jgi:Dolichyl-phosphate-mannose-protein mannosyltransferase
VLARSAWATWGVLAQPEDWYIREWVIRFPAWLAGIFAVLALALLVARLAGKLAGVMSAWLLALHPWFLRYASEARGYSVLLLMVPVTLLVWLRATRENLWRWWLGLAACQFLVLWVFPAAIYILVVLNGLTALWLGGEWLRRPDETRFRRWLAANTMAAIPATQMMLPLVPQLLNYLGTAPEAQQPLHLSWLVDISSNLLVGATWNKSGSLSSPYVELASRAHEHPAFFVSLLVVFGVSALAGTVRLRRRMWPQGAIVALSLLVPAVIAAGVARLRINGFSIGI